MVRNLDQNAASKAIVVPRISRGADGGLHSALSVLAQSVISALFPGDSMNYRLVLAAVVTTALDVRLFGQQTNGADPGEKPVGAGNCVRARYRRGDDTGRRAPR
jgi:hypothetical protein